jgi:hypothetical protein
MQRLKFAAAFAGAALLLDSNAWAGLCTPDPLQLELSEKGHASRAVCGSGTTIDFFGPGGGTFGDYSLGNVSGQVVSTSGLQIGAEVTLKSHGSGALVETLTDTNMSAPKVAQFLSELSVGLTDPRGARSATASVSLATYIGNTLLDTITLSFDASGSAKKTAESGVLDLTGAFTMSEVLTIDATAPGQIFTIDPGTSVKIPEPASLGLLGAALFGTGWITRRRRRRL